MFKFGGMISKISIPNNYVDPKGKDGFLQRLIDTWEKFNHYYENHDKPRKTEFVGRYCPKDKVGFCWAFNPKRAEKSPAF